MRVYFHLLLAVPMFFPVLAVADTKSPTRSESEKTLTRCIKSGGKLKICCAAAGGTYEPGKTSNSCILEARKYKMDKAFVPNDQNSKILNMYRPAQ